MAFKQLTQGLAVAAIAAAAFGVALPQAGYADSTASTDTAEQDTHSVAAVRAAMDHLIDRAT